MSVRSSERLQELQKYMRALHCPTRWVIIDFIGRGGRETREIYEHLLARGERMSPSGLYYHLAELKSAGIVDVAEYREEGGGAPRKVWKLKTEKIVIDLLEGEGGKKGV